MSLPELALRRPVTILMVYTTLFLLGGIAVKSIPLEFLPDLTGPNFWIEIPYRNATPVEVERTVAIPAEELLQTVPNLNNVTTQSQNNSCTILLEFDWGTEMDYAYLDVKDRLDRLMEQLPRESQNYFIWRFSAADIEIMFMSFYWDGPVDELYEILNDRIKPRLQRVDGVGSVTMWGHAPRQVFVDLNQDLLKAHGISLYDLVMRLDRSSFTLGSGEISEGGDRYLVRIAHEFEHLEDLANFRVNPKGLRLRDVAEIRFGYPEQTAITRMNGRSAISMGVKKESGANTVEVCEAVRRELDRVLASPGFSGIRSSIFFDQSSFILTSFESLRNAGLWGGLFALFVLFFFLRRILATGLVAVAIPISLMVAVMVMFFSGMTLNIISMVGLMLGVGMLVDNSIVVSENIFRLRAQGLTPRDASGQGSREVSLAILAATLTTIIVFLPMVFMDMGILRVYTREVGIAISLSLLASLFVALTFIPLVAARLPQGRAVSGGSRLLGALTGRYSRGLAWALSHRSHVLSLLVILVVLTVMIPMKRVPQKGEPTGDTRRMVLDVRLAGAQERGRVDDVLQEVERAILGNREELEIENIFVQSGYLAERNRVSIFLREGTDVRLTTDEVKVLLLERLPVIPDVKFSIPEVHGGGEGGQNEIKILITGSDPETLEGIAGEVVRRVSGLPGILDAATDLEPGHDEMHILVDRALSVKHRVSPMVVAQTVAFGLRGFPLRKMKTEDREMDVLVQLEKSHRQDVSTLQDLQLLTEDGELIPLYVAARFREAPGKRVIRREGGRRAVNVRVQTTGEALSIHKTRLEDALAPMPIPPGYRLEFGRVLEDLERTRKSFGYAILFSILLIYFLLGALFESYVHPFTILVAVPLALVGSYWVMFASGSAMDVAAFIGLILMVGIVVNNAIVIVHRMNQLRRFGLGREESVLQAGVDRLRPVLMTAATTILGLLPLAFGGAGLGGMVMFAPLGKAVVGGLAVSTLLTLFVVPVFYVYVDEIGEALQRLYSLARSRKPGPVPT